ncbi:hypothetical protein FACS1894139_01610 [Planctomycetales bacterium]|nr:hypothetical protein FACS1894139_01610 [Planctomycetales bacterium]GHV21512.1 hypothetical protein AGMMS49959_10760 [Planctomycetales bacterium]
MKRFFIAAAMSALATGCGCGASAGAGGKPHQPLFYVNECNEIVNGIPPAKKIAAPVATIAPSQPQYTVCNQFYQLADPFAASATPATPAAKIAYAQTGYQCARRQGLVPLSPRFGVPALDCPWTRSVDEDLPPQFAAAYGGVHPAAPSAALAPVAALQPSAPNERGYLLTAYDTPRGVRYVIIEAERNFNATATLLEVEKDFPALVRALRNLTGRAVVYLTNYPLIAGGGNATSRVLQDAEIAGLKNALNERAAAVSFVNWQ